jgi:hypothetical protein
MQIYVTQHCVTGAIYLHARRGVFGARLVAAITGLWLLTCGFVVARHEAEVSHVRDRAGHIVHGVLAGESHGNDSGPRATLRGRHLAAVRLSPRAEDLATSNLMSRRPVGPRMRGTICESAHGP